MSGDLDDGANAYLHYRNGNGTDLRIDYEKAYKEDSVIRSSIDELIKIAQEQAVSLNKCSGDTSYNIRSDLYGIPNGETENWQKTIGAHYVWVSATVKVVNGTYLMDMTIHMKDKYNFNKEMSDIASKTPDDVNGHFAVLGWAKSFFTIGELKRTVTWEGSSPSISSPQENKSR